MQHCNFLSIKKKNQEDCFIWHSRNGKITENRKQTISQGIGAVGSGGVSDRTVSCFLCGSNYTNLYAMKLQRTIRVCVYISAYTKVNS